MFTIGTTGLIVLIAIGYLGLRSIEDSVTRIFEKRKNSKEEE